MHLQPARLLIVASRYELGIISRSGKTPIMNVRVTLLWLSMGEGWWPTLKGLCNLFSVWQRRWSSRFQRDGWALWFLLWLLSMHHKRHEISFYVTSSVYLSVLVNLKKARQWFSDNIRSQGEVTQDTMLDITSKSLSFSMDINLK